MHIDATTLSDLEVFKSPDGSDGLFQLIDRTATARGRKALHRRVAQPMSEGREIRRTQDAVRFFTRHPRLFWVDDQPVEAVDRYLRTNIEHGDGFTLGDQVEYWWMTIRYPDVLRELRDGVGATVALFEQLDALEASIAPCAPPDLVAELLAQLRAGVAAVLRARDGLGNVLTVDRACRTGVREEIDRALAAVAELDALNAMALATAALGWTMPEVIESDSFLVEARDVYHPFVAGPVRNPVHLSGGVPLVFLTGPNMAGKTTYLRSVALLVFLAQLGMGVPAGFARLTPVEALLTSLNPADNVRAGLSYFLAEVRRVREAATLLADGRRALVLFDEVFKGTNVRDALEASAEVILGFARARRSGSVFSSHLVELVDVLKTSPGIRFCCFDGDFAMGAPLYSYRLRDGVSDKRFGLLLLREAKVPELLARISA